MKVTLNGCGLGYEVRGENGIPLVLIHGFGMDRQIWYEVVSTTLAKVHVILVDVRGHGESDAPEGPYSMSEMAGDILALLDYLMIPQAIICGHSMGGYISLAVAAEYPDRLAGLALITSRAHADSEVQRENRFALIEKVRKEGSIALAETLAPKLSRNAEIIKQAYDIILRTSPHGIIGSTFAMAERPDRMDLLPKIDVASLVVAGEEDQIVGIKEAKQMAASIPQATFLPITDVGHLPMLEKPEDLGDGLISLMEKVRG